MTGVTKTTGKRDLIVSTHDLCWLHDPGGFHPESPARLTAVRDGLVAADLSEAITWVESPEVTREAIAKTHAPELFDQLDALCQTGGGAIDPDTTVSADSFRAARRAAGAGLDLIERLNQGEADVGWSVVRPPGHHATMDRQMGFCLFNNIAVAAKSLTEAGQRVLIVDVDAHHGNGTQDIFYDDPNVLFVSFHQFPWYPYTGRPDEVGTGDGLGTTVNIPLPSATSGYTYRSGFESVVVPVVQRFKPDWVLVSAGFDGHRDDPITELGLTSGDYADLIDDVLHLAPAGRRLMFLEGGYNLQALAHCAGAVAAKVVGDVYRPEEPTSGGPGEQHVEAARRIHIERGPDEYGADKHGTDGDSSPRP